MTQRIGIRVHAKVNLFLRILGRRDDGYHDIETVMHPIALADEIWVERRERGFVLECEGEPAPLGEDNSVARAWQALSTACPGRLAGCRAVLRKSIPSQSGMGGASADGAGALLALDRLFDLRLSAEALRAAAASIGSDTPFFLCGGPAIAEGRGEVLTPLRGSLAGPLAVVASDRGVSTAEAYRRFAPDAGEQSLSAREMASAVEAGAGDRASRRLFNTFERLIFPVRPDLARTKEALLAAGAAGALMTGSGAAVFALGLAPRSLAAARDRIERDPGKRLIETALAPRSFEWV